MVAPHCVQTVDTLQGCGADPVPFGRAASITDASTHQTSPCREKNRNLPSDDRVGLLSTCRVFTAGPRFAGVVHEPSGLLKTT